MRTEQRNLFWLQLIWILLLAIPLVLILALPGGTMLTGGMWLWMMMLLLIWVVWSLVAGTMQSEAASVEKSAEDLGPRMILPDEQPSLIRELMDVRVAQEDDGVQAFRGRLRQRADATLDRLQQSLPDTIVPLVQQDEQFGAAIILMPLPVERAVLEKPVRPALHWLLLGLTFLTTTWAGAMHQGVNLLEEPGRFTVGLPYSIGLLSILGIHELGHYFTALYHGLRVTPPYFIPVPFALGTFGAFIQMRSPTRNRRALFDVAVAGPLAGLVVAIPALMLGLQTSEIIPNNAADAGAVPLRLCLRGTSVGSSMLFAFVSKLALGPELQYGDLIRLSPLAFAGWLGLLVTALNLLPIGQLDGGHMTRAMFGSRVGQSISSLALWSLFLLAIFVWPGLLIWAIIVYFIAGRGTPPLNDITPISPTRRAVGYFTLLILAVILLPMPRALWQAASVCCPYL
jgi:Zn-dependent protease